MGLFDSILGSVLGGGSGSNQSTLANLAIGLLTNHSSGNGLAGLVQQFEQQGLGHLAQSWVGTGPNLPVSPDQIEQVLGSDKIKELAAKAGVDSSQINAALAQYLPQIINHLTPNGQVPQGADLQQSIGGLLQKFGITA
jgi:uncharacterized protein YidB (DUF937 family)